MPTHEFIVRPASVADIDVIARHRAEMMRDIHALDDAQCSILLDQSRMALGGLLAAGEYLGWLASSHDDPQRIVAGTGIRLRSALPSVHKQDGVMKITVGRQGLIVNVFTEREWRRRGIAALLMRELLLDAKRLDLGSLVLHASDDGRALYESLGFVATNEMRYVGSLTPESEI